jgi:DNA-directed RNA polymerase specialized sigma24 family protein
MLAIVGGRGDVSLDAAPVNGATAEAGREPERRPWVLSREAFLALLASLDPDTARAGEKYEVLRQRLIAFFLGRGSTNPEDRTDETLDRVSRRIAEGEPVESPTRFAYGVARRVHGEWLRSQRRQRRLLAQHGATVAAATVMETDAGVECLRLCAKELAAPDHALILAYYEGTGGERRADRQELANRLGITPTALRLRSFRIRRSLETCTMKCLGARARVDRGQAR